MKTAQLKSVAPASAVARPTMAQRATFKAAPAPSVARPSFARRVQKLQKAAGVQARNVVVVRAADDKVRPGVPARRLWGPCSIRQRTAGPASRPWRLQLVGIGAVAPERRRRCLGPAPNPAAPRLPARRWW